MQHKSHNNLQKVGGLFAFHQQHDELHLLRSARCGGAEQGSRMMGSVTAATSFHFNCSVPSIPLLPAPPCWRSGCASFPLSLPRHALGAGMLLGRASHAHSFVWHAADNTLGIKGPRQWRTIKELFLSLPPAPALPPTTHTASNVQRVKKLRLRQGSVFWFFGDWFCSGSPCVAVKLLHVMKESQR